MRRDEPVGRMEVTEWQARLIAELAFEIAHDEAFKGYRNNAQDWDMIQARAFETAERLKRRRLG